MAKSTSFPEFDSHQARWESYIARFNIFASVIEVKEDKKAYTLLNALGRKMFDLLADIEVPKKPQELTYDQIVSTLTKQFNPAPLIVAESFKFHRRDQQRGESISEYLTTLRQLADRCNYRDSRTEWIRDRLVCGLTEIPLQRALLATADLTLDGAVKTALAYEAAAK